MNKNKGIIGLGLILAIVLGVVVVGGGAYYLGKGSNKQNTGVIIEENTLSNNNDGDINKKEQIPSRGFAVCEKDTTPWVILVSPNGGESYVLNQKIDVKWKSCNIPEGVDMGISILNELKLNPLTIAENVAIQQTSNDGIETIYLTEQKDMQKFILGNKFKIRLNYVFTEKYTGPMPEGRHPEWAAYNDDSDNYFSVQSNLEESSTENFKNQPGSIKSIKADGANKWIFAVDLLSPNPNWAPGVNDIYLNQNTKIRNLNVTENTKVYNCDGRGNLYLFTNISTYVSNIQKDIDQSKIDIKNRIGGPIEKMTDWETLNFDIDGSSIKAIYDICLP